MTALDAATLVLTLVAIAFASLRFLRVAQREHYLAGAAVRFSARWWHSTPENIGLGLAGIVAAVVSALLAPLALVTAAVAAVAPRGLGLRGRTSRLSWTRRLATVALVSGLLACTAVALGAVGGGLDGAVTAAALAALLAPLFVDLALVLTRPVEEIVAKRYVRLATERLGQVRPIVVGVTGSYGKTTVKGYIAHLAGAHRSVLPSPRSYNNRAGLARTVNEYLGPATEVLIAEMGTYGPGEIASMCSWLRPSISVITAIGPAHLERFRRLDRTLAAKAEICETASVIILNADDERLLGLGKVLRAAGKRVIEASGTNEVADVAVLETDEGLELRVGGHRLGVASVTAQDRPAALSNAACAVAATIELGVPAESILARLVGLPVASNRLQRYLADGGYVVLDDTFNSNPSGARIGLARLRQEAPGGQRVVVTPGMVELGPLQYELNADFGEAAARIASTLIFVARTNRQALEAGAARANGQVEVITVERLDTALAWVRQHLQPSDAVLYENDLPDHFP